jgi:hypothetical protein
MGDMEAVEWIEGGGGDDCVPGLAVGQVVVVVVFIPRQLVDVHRVHILQGDPGLKRQLHQDRFYSCTRTQPLPAKISLFYDEQI